MKRIKDKVFSIYCRGVVGLLRRWGVSNRFISQSIARAYDDGYKAGMLQFAKENLGKSYVKKVKKVIKRAYSRENL
tara:strand:+ start:1505 stop:1732 length:228 start_codon:yes stop_codon:yes gene_type:complete